MNAGLWSWGEGSRTSAVPPTERWTVVLGGKGREPRTFDRALHPCLQVRQMRDHAKDASRINRDIVFGVAPHLDHLHRVDAPLVPFSPQVRLITHLQLQSVFVFSSRRCVLLHNITIAMWFFHPGGASFPRRLSLLESCVGWFVGPSIGPAGPLVHWSARWKHPPTHSDV